MVEGFACDTEEWAVVGTQRADLEHEEEMVKESHPARGSNDDVVDSQLVEMTREMKSDTPLKQVCW